MLSEWFGSQNCADLLHIVLAAELIFLITRSADILITLKGTRQRTRSEQTRIDRGLVRSIVLEALVFVPASAFLVSLLKPLLVSPSYLAPMTSAQRAGVHTAVGIASYGFPFAAVRRFVSHVALTTLREFSTIASTADQAHSTTPVGTVQGGGDA